MDVIASKKVFILESTLTKWYSPSKTLQKVVRKSIALYQHLVNSTVQSYWLLVSITSSCTLSSLLHHCVDVLSFLENVVCESKRRQTKSVNMLTALETGDSMITSQRLNIVDEHDTKDDHDDTSYTTGNSSLMVTCNKLITPIALLLVALFI